MDTEMPAQTARMHQTLDPVVRILNVVFRLDMFDRHNLIGDLLHNLTASSPCYMLPRSA